MLSPKRKVGRTQYVTDQIMLVDDRPNCQDLRIREVTISMLLNRIGLIV